MAIEVEPKFFYSYLNLANVYVGIGGFNEAKKYLKEAIKINNNVIYIATEDGIEIIQIEY